MRLAPRAAIPAGLFLLSLIVFSGALQHSFTNWDDDEYVTANPLIRNLDRDRLETLFSRPYFNNWAPLTLLSYAADHAFWGQRPLGYHLTNIVLHALCTVLLFELLCALVRPAGPNPVLPAALAAVLFAIHPVQVESVAWISERKNVLGMALFLGAFLAWMRSRRAPFRPAAYALFLGLAAGSGLAKVQGALLLPLLLVLEWTGQPAATRRLLRLRWRLGLLSPALALALAVVWLNFDAQPIDSARRLTGDLLGASATAPVLLLGYVKDLLLPTNRTPLLSREIYAAPWELIPALAWLLVLAALGAVLAGRQRHPHLAFFVLWFAGALVPVLNFVAIPVLAADRYQYWAAPGLFALAAIGVSSWYQRSSARRRAWQTGLLIVTALLLSALTVNYVRVWKDSVSLWGHAVRAHPHAWKARMNLSDALFQIGSLEAATDHAREASRLVPDEPFAHKNLAAILMGLGQFDEAEQAIREALRLDPRDAASRGNLGFVLLQRGEPRGAERALREAIRIDPDQADVYLTLGNALLAQERPLEAERALRDAVRLDPGLVEARVALGGALFMSGRLAEAKRELEEAFLLDPGNKLIRTNLEIVEEMLRRSEDPVSTPEAAPR